MKFSLLHGVLPFTTPSYLLLQQSPPQRDPLLQLPPLLVMLSIRLHLDLALVRVEQLQLLLQLHP